jgi:hypothetical protein
MLIVAIRYIIASLLPWVKEYHTFSLAVKSEGKKKPLAAMERFGASKSRLGFPSKQEL